MSETTHFFGIGAQKAGTTWLNDVLATYPDCAVPEIKELHFFDIRWQFDDEASTEDIYFTRLRTMEQLAAGLARDIGDYARRARRRALAPDSVPPNGVLLPRIFREGYLGNVGIEARSKMLCALARYFAIRDMADYRNYLEETRRQKGARVVGEITPAYSLLPAEAFREIDSHFPGCRFLFIMRDPLGRFISQLQFKRKYLATRGKPFDAVAYLDEALSDPNFLLRSNYRRTIETVESCVDADRVMHLFFEQMVAPATVVPSMRRVESFLGLAPKEERELLAFCEQKKNASAAIELSPAQIARVRAALEPVYAYVEQRFGRRPDGWAYELA